MKKFKYKRKCPKCAQRDILNIFVRKGKFYVDIHESREANRDLMHRRCNTCSYNWNEKTI